MAHVRIVDVILGGDCERYLYTCLAPVPFRRYEYRQRYMKMAVPRGFRKKLLICDGDPVGQIEYASSEASGYPISGENVIVMNCIWVLRRGKGHRFGKMLMDEMIADRESALGFATIGLEKHWSRWFRKEEMECLGFRSIDSVEVSHKLKRKGEHFKIHLMWLPFADDARRPELDRLKMLEGVNFCMAHPLYHSQQVNLKEILEAHRVE